MDDLPELPFEQVLGYLILEDLLKTRAVSRRWYQKINSFRVKSLCYSKCSSLWKEPLGQLSIRPELHQLHSIHQRLCQLDLSGNDHDPANANSSLFGNDPGMCRCILVCVQFASIARKFELRLFQLLD